MAITEYAYTERYVVLSGAGSKNGLSWANAFDFAGMVADFTAGSRYNVTGDHAPSSSPTTVTGSRLVPFAIQGWKADQSAFADSFDDMPSISGSGHAGVVLATSAYNQIAGLEIKNGATHGISRTTGNYSAFDLIYSHDNGGDGIIMDFVNNLTRSRIIDNGGNGVDADSNSNIIANEIWGNTARQIDGTSESKFLFNYIRGTGAGDGIYLTTIQQSLIAFNTIDNCGAGVNILTPTSNGGGMYFANLFTNNSVALENNGTTPVMFCGFDGNSVDGAVCYGHNTGNVYVDPAYVDISNNDFEVTAAEYLAQDIGNIGALNIGAWQSSGGGADGPTKGIMSNGMWR